VPALNKAQLNELLPHAGAMCLLASVDAWDEVRIVCTAESHTDPHNPLRYGDRLPAIAGLEYTAQAMAVHCGLLANGARAPPTLGYLGAVRNLHLHVQRLDDLAGPITVSAERLIGDRTAAVYALRLAAQDRVLVTGQASVFLRVSPP
jgi:predicted hotdog family 3-hydroxylacyl-ACP dehydratase